MFWHDNIFAKPRTKMMTASRFSRQNEAGLRALNVVLWENLVVVLVLESKGPYYQNIIINESQAYLCYNSQI